MGKKPDKGKNATAKYLNPDVQTSGFFYDQKSTTTPKKLQITKKLRKIKSAKFILLLAADLKMKDTNNFNALSAIRRPWDKDLKIIVHNLWDYPHEANQEDIHNFYGTPLKHHKYYEAAKREQNYAAGAKLVIDMLKENAIQKLKETINTRDVHIVAPSLTEGESRNTIPILFAHAVSCLIDAPVAKSIYQSVSISRTSTNGFFRVVNQPGFYGQVEKGRDYVLVDDNATLGSTLASLRSYIEEKGGNVVAISVLSAQKKNVPLSPNTERDILDYNLNISEETRSLLEKRHDQKGKLNGFMEEHLGWGISSLTNAEANFLLKQSTDVIKNRITSLLYSNSELDAESFTRHGYTIQGLAKHNMGERNRQSPSNSQQNNTRESRISTSDANPTKIGLSKDGTTHPLPRTEVNQEQNKKPITDAGTIEYKKEAT